MHKVSSKNTILRECYVTYVLAYGYMLTGILFSFPACLIPQFEEEGYEISTIDESLLGSLVALVVAITSFFTSVLTGKRGRRQTLQISFALYFIGFCIIAFSPSIIVTFVGLGLAAIVSSLFVPLTIPYISEMCDKKRRGVLLSAAYITLTIGGSTVYIMNSFLSWRTMAIVTAIISAIGFVQMYLIPESMYWYLLKGDRERAKESMQWFRAMKPEEMDREIEIILKSIDCSTNVKKGDFAEYMRSLREMKYLKPFLVSMIINTFRSGNGRVIIGVYMVDIFKDLGTPYEFKKISLWFGVSDILGCISVLVIVYKLSRKVVLYGSTFVVMVCLGITIIYRFLEQARVIHLPPWVPVVCIFVYSMVILSAYMSTMSLIVSEIQYAYFRAQASSMQRGWGGIMTFAYKFSFPYVQVILPIEYILLWFMLNIVVTAAMVYFFVPETSKFEFYENEVTKTENPA